MSDERLARLEERIAWLERHVLEQDKVMLTQGEELKRLRGQLELVRERVASRDLPLDPNEKPPHY